VEGYYKAEARSATVGAFFMTKRITIDQITCKVLLWDTAGADQFQKLAQTYYNGAAAAIITYDVSEPASLKKLQHWLDEVQRNTVGRRIVLAVVACKCDLPPAPGVQQEAQRLAQAVDAIYMETSSKNNTNIQELFRVTAERVLQYQTQATQGTGLPIPVKIGTGNASNTSRMRRRSSPPNLNKHQIGLQQQQQQMHLRRNSNNTMNDGSSPNRNLMILNNNNINGTATIATMTTTTTTTTTSSPSKNNPILDQATPETDEGSLDEIVDDPNSNGNSDAASNSNGVMCDGAMLVCGTGDKSCAIM
jgi:small GTP-binding protein